MVGVPSNTLVVGAVRHSFYKGGHSTVQNNKNKNPKTSYVCFLYSSNNFLLGDFYSCFVYLLEIQEFIFMLCYYPQLYSPVFHHAFKYDTLGQTDLFC